VHISCAHAIFTMRSVVEHYCKSGSTVTVCTLDISKAFDRVNNCALLSLLIDRKVPKHFITIMLKWFQHSTASVRWGGALSATFNILAGVILDKAVYYRHYSFLSIWMF